MPISKAQFKEAFREVISSEFSHIPKDENDIEFAFSKRFTKRMEKLINSQKKVYYKLINTACKRVAIVFVLIITIFTAAFSVKAIREPIINFIKQVYESFTYYTFGGDTVEIITKEYNITEIPDDYEQIEKTTEDNLVVTTYKNSLGNTIIFSQMTTEYSIGYFVDNESGNLYVEKVGNIEVEFKEWYDTKTAMWVAEGYVFTLDCIGSVSNEDIKQIILSIN